MNAKGKGTILIVDDEFAIAETLKDLLEDEGYGVVLAPNGKEGLARVAEERPNLILVDVMMPILGGLEMVRALRAEPAHREIPVIVMSSAPRSAAVKANQDANEIVAFFRKPFRLSVLLSTIAQLLDAPQVSP